MSCRQSCQSRHPCTKGNIRAVCEESHFYSLPPATVHAVATTNSKNVETLPRKTTFLASNRSWSQVCEIQYWPPSSLPFKGVPPSLEYGLVLLETLIRGVGGSQAQDHGQVIYAKIQYSRISFWYVNTILSQVLLQLVVACTSPRVILTLPKNIFDDEWAWLQFFCNLNSPKILLAHWVSEEQDIGCAFLLMRNHCWGGTHWFPELVYTVSLTCSLHTFYKLHLESSAGFL